jgi:prepilin signal peptidase PulO-like enzyme (type II secretory pathway)
MNAVAAATGGFALTVGFWHVARRTGRSRGLEIGRLPFPLPAAVAIAGVCLSSGTAAAPSLVGLGGSAVAALLDVRTGLIFDPLVASVFAMGMLVGWYGGHVAASIAGSAVLGAILAALYATTRGCGIGLGDVKLGTALGAALGARIALDAIGIAFVTGAAYGAYLLATRRATRRSAIPFGPFIAIGTCAAVLWPGGPLP